ncbi:MAG TPA: hypothetical protein PKY63_07310 [Bacteroidales bacterium]|nr:hypothetical protein [Bacteroidales bacterium]
MKNIVVYLLLIILDTSCRFSDPVIGIRTNCEKGVYKGYNTVTQKLSVEKTDSAHYIDTFVYYRIKKKICLDFSNKSIFAEISTREVYNSNKNNRYKFVSRKVPAFMWDGWVRYYNKNKEFKQKKITRKQYRLVQCEGTGGYLKLNRDVIYNKDGTKTVTKTRH